MFNAYKASADKTQKGGNKFRVFKFPENVKFKKFDKAGDYLIDIIPARITGKNHPAVRDGAAVGDLVYVFDYWRHMEVGPEKAVVLCPQSTFGKKCPICEAADEAKVAYGPKSREFTSLIPKHRVLYNIAVLKEAGKAGNPDEFLLLDESFALFEKELITFAGAKARRKGLDYIPFGDLEAGWSVFFTVERAKMEGGFEYSKFKSFDLEEKDDPRSNADAKKAISPDQYLNVMTYEQLKALFDGDEYDDGGDEPPTTRTREAETEASPSREEGRARPNRSESTASTEASLSEPAESKTSHTERCPNGLRFGKDVSLDNEECNDCSLFLECRKAKRLSA